MKIDLNCDLGEGEPLGRTRELMEWIDSANVACGGHAGDADSMRDCVRLALAHDVNLGTHPGPWNRADMGRGNFEITTSEFRSLVIEQVGGLRQIAESEGSKIHHIKLHGALYHAVERDEELAEAYVKLVQGNWPESRIIAFAGGLVASFGKNLGVQIWEEAFADRAYQKSGALVSRKEKGAVLHDIDEIVQRVNRLKKNEGILTECGANLSIRCDTICVHSDSPNALKVVQKLSHMLNESF